MQSTQFHRAARLLLALALLWPLTCFAAQPLACEAPERKNSYQIGLGLQSLLPGGLPELTESLLTYGPHLAIPLFGHYLQIRASYGSAEGQWGYILESSFRFDFSLPFFKPYVAVGGQYLRYSGSATHDEIGAQIGFGLRIPVADRNLFTLGTKVLGASRPVIGFETNLLFLL